MPNAEGALQGWDFALPTAEPPRALWARTQRALKSFLLGAPEDALLDSALVDRTQTHLAAVALLTLPLCFAWLAGSAMGRAAILLSMVSGLLIAVRLEASERERTNPIALLMGGVVYAVALSGVAWEALGPAALSIDPNHALAASVAGLGLLATRSDPRLCVLGAAVGALSVGALHALGTTASDARLAPALLSVGGAALASTLAAARGRRLQRAAVLDSASGALHAAAFERCVRDAQQNASAAAQPLTLARIEFSALREIRATHGHALGDALLRWLASELTDRFRTTDLLGRTGEDEFSLVLLDTDHPGVERRLENVQRELETIELSRNGLREPVALRVAFGVAALPREAIDAASARKLVDQRLALARWQARRLA
ncbi:MAG TPA: GGDEF domain-containing protein [Myxococcota bacterium]